jgi:predicted RNA-binding Zn-ribbon protein involved in translation (DUF1610 family)
MDPEFKVRCASCGFANKLRIGRVYNKLLCENCGAEIDTDASATLDLLMDTKPVTLRRDTVTVGFRPREDEDWMKCQVCGTKADLDAEDVLDVNSEYQCRKCGHIFHINKKCDTSDSTCGA